MYHINDGVVNMNDQKWKDVDENIGKKNYNINEKGQIDRCVNELVVRQYLKLRKFVNVTQLIKVQPENVQKYIEGTYNKAAYIRENFYNVKEDIEEFIIKNKIQKVELYIERGKDVGYSIHEAASDSDEIKLKLIRDIFSLVNDLHHIGVVHTDLKPFNFIWGSRTGNGDKTGDVKRL